MTDDEATIRKVIAQQFGSLNWRPGTSGDWAAFMAGAPLYAAAPNLWHVAIAVAGCEITENDADVTRGVEMMLLVKDAGA
jgi:hypothetical protein